MRRHFDSPTRSDTQVVGLSAPTSGAPRTTRASDADRQRVMDLLQAHFVAGRLTSVELEERVERALASRTFADLDALLADLPRIETPSAERAAPDERSAGTAHPCHGEKGVAAHATSYLLVMALLVTVWLLTTPGGYFWPIWPMLGWGIGLASHGLAARGISRRGSRRARLAA